MPTQTRRAPQRRPEKAAIRRPAWWLTTRPATKAPSARDKPEAAWDANAVPKAGASTANVKSPLEPVRATCSNSQAASLVPTKSISAPNARALSSPMPAVGAHAAGSRGPRATAKDDARVSGSSANNHPMVSQPGVVSARFLSTRARRPTMVLGMATSKPSTRPPTSGQPQARARPNPARVRRATLDYGGQGRGSPDR